MSFVFQAIGHWPTENVIDSLLIEFTTPMQHLFYFHSNFINVFEMLYVY